MILSKNMIFNVKLSEEAKITYIDASFVQVLFKTFSLYIKIKRFKKYRQSSLLIKIKLYIPLIKSKRLRFQKCTEAYFINWINSLKKNHLNNMTFRMRTFQSTLLALTKISTNDIEYRYPSAWIYTKTFQLRDIYVSFHRAKWKFSKWTYSSFK